MTGSFAYSRDADVAASAREQLDRAASAVQALESAQRTALAELIELWGSSAWLAAGATSAKAWLLASTGLSVREAQRLERIAGMCAGNWVAVDPHGTRWTGRPANLTTTPPPISERQPTHQDA